MLQDNIQNVDLLHLYPDVLKENKTVKDICKVQEPELKIAWENVINMYKNQWLDTIDEYGCKRWEGILGITPLKNDSLADRRFRIITYIKGNLPYTMKNLKNILTSIVGNKDDISVIYEQTTFTLTVTIGLTNKNYLEEVKKMLFKIVPANIVINLNFKYNTHNFIKSKKLTYNELKALKHNTIRNEVLS